MTDVKIYTITSDDLSPPIEGEGFCTDMVRHSDYAALEERLNQMAAENAALREYRPQPSGAAMMEALDAFYEYHEDVPEQGMMAAFEILCCKRPQALATDALQREQMAKGVEMFSEQQRSYIGKPSKNDAASSYCSREALKFSTQIRQGELS